MNRLSFLIISCFFVVQYSVHAMNFQEVDWGRWEKKYPLHSAAQLDDISKLTQLIKDNANLDQQDNQGLTALHCAIRTANINAVHWLLEHGADPDIGDKHGCTPLFLAACYNFCKIAECLLYYGAKLNDLRERINLELANFPDMSKLLDLWAKKKWQAQQARTTFALILHPRPGKTSNENLKNIEIIRNILQNVHARDFSGNLNKTSQRSHLTMIQSILRNRYLQASALIGLGLFTAGYLNYMKNK